MKKLGNYEIKKCIGSTELTMLYEASHCYLGSDLVIEASPAENNEHLQNRLKFLAQLLGKLKHPKILPIVDAFEDGKMFYLVFEWFHNLANCEVILKNEQKFSLDEALNIILKTCEVLRYIHLKGTVHQNLQLDNILLGKGLFFIGGFTLANTLENSFDEYRLKLEDARYASPEWLLRKPVCKEQDIWSLGVCFYRMLTGIYPFEGDIKKEVGEYILAGEYKKIEEVDPNIPEAIAQIIGKMLSVDPEKRPSLEEIVEAVEGQLYLNPIASAFIAMPFHPQFNRVYQVIKNVCQKKRIKPVRVDENILPSNIWNDIEEGIKNSAFVIADLSIVPGPNQSNPNVTFEVGIAHNLHKPTVLLTQNIELLPFDFKQQRTHVYKNNEEALKVFEEKLSDVVTALIKEQNIH